MSKISKRMLGGCPGRDQKKPGRNANGERAFSGPPLSSLDGRPWDIRGMTDEQGRRRGPLAELKYPAAGGANSVLKTAAACPLRAIAL